MKAPKHWIMTVTLAAGVALFGCAEAEEAATPAAAAEVATTPEDGPKAVTLTEKAVERLGIEMTPVTTEGGGRVVPYDAVVYDPDGGTYVFTSPKARTYVRSSITVNEILGDKALLSDGPDAGTNVVTVGTAELYGTEQGLGQTAPSGH